MHEHFCLKAVLLWLSKGFNLYTYHTIRTNTMHFIQLLIPIPFVIVTIRLLLQRFIQCSHEAIYMRITRELTVACLCGPVLLTSLYSRLFTSTPYIAQELDCLTQFVLIQLFAALLEFRTHLQDLGLVAFLLSYMLYICQSSLYWQTFLYWLMVFHILRTPETLLTVVQTPLGQGDEVHTKLARTLFQTLKKLEFVVLFAKSIHLYVYHEPSEGTFSDMFSTILYLTFAYGDVGSELFIYHIFHREVQATPTGCVVAYVPDEFRQREDELLRRFRHSGILALQNEQGGGDDPAINTTAPSANSAVDAPATATSPTANPATTVASPTANPVTAVVSPTANSVTTVSSPTANPVTTVSSPTDNNLTTTEVS